ncbi:MAG: FAD:protein FMN transferase [Anaerolineae bacterium]|nr:FAD:protein FMN transferase [Anaerolineae bacterium]
MTTKMKMMTSTIAPATWRWTRHDFRAMNTEVAVELFSSQPNHHELLLDVERLFTSFERRLSRFNPSSELSQLNACRQPIFAASPTLIDAVEVALWAAAATGGVYDPTTLSALEQAGYDRSFETIDNRSPLTQLPERKVTEHQTSKHRRPAYTFRSVTVHRARRKIAKPTGLRLDLGGMGKGWTVDRAADALQGVGPFLINAGGDLFAYSSPPGSRGWPIDISHPLDPEQIIANVDLHHRALATSTITKRRWQRDGQTMHHLIDPRTGQPAQTDALSVSVIADRTVMAEVYAKAALVLGVEQGLNFLQHLPGIEGFIFAADSTIVQTDGFHYYISKRIGETYDNHDFQTQTQ